MKSRSLKATTQAFGGREVQALAGGAMVSPEDERHTPPHQEEKTFLEFTTFKKQMTWLEYFGMFILISCF